MFLLNGNNSNFFIYRNLINVKNENNENRENVCRDFFKNF